MKATDKQAKRTPPQGGSFMGIGSLVDLVKQAGLSEDPSVPEKVRQDLTLLENTLNSQDMEQVSPEVKDLIIFTFKDLVSILTEGKSEVLVKRREHGDM